MELPIKSRMPMPGELLHAYVSSALLLGFVVDRRRAQMWIPLAIMMKTGFEDLMRPREVGELRVGDCLLPRSVLGLRRSAVLLVRRPKTRRLLGRMQHVLLRDKWAIAWLSWVLADAPDDLLVLPGGARALGEGMKLIGEILHVAHLGLRGGALRSGGATAFLEERENVPLLRVRGRWLSERSLEHYLQECMCVLVMQRITPEAETLIETVAGFWRTFSRPPALPWKDFFTRDVQIQAQIGVIQRALRAKGISM